jgi:type II secretory pathway component GspD/PulD (secretin)
MKKMLVVTSITGFLILCQTALCQTQTPDTSPPAAPAASSAATDQTADTNAVTTTTVAADTNAPAAAVTNAEAAAATPVATGDTNAAPVATGDTNAAAPAAVAEQPAEEAPATPPAAELPIQFQDVPITTAIESLARLGGINYLLDPKIGYGQPDEHGVIKPEPVLSIRWEHVTAQQALVALLDNYGLQLVENPKTKIAKITTKDPTAPPPLVTRVIQLKYASTSNMVAAVQSTLADKRSRVIADVRTSQMVVSATEREQADVDTMVSQLDRPTRQVLIETKLVEINSDPKTTKGIDWSGTLQAQNVSFGNNALPSLPPQPAIQGIGGTASIPATQGTIGGILPSAPVPGILANTQNGFDPETFFLNADGVRAVFSFLNASSDAQIVSTPRIVTLDNETASITVTRAFPIINVTAGTANTTGGSSLTYSNLGTILFVTPRISANDYIWMKVTPSVSSFFGTVTKVVNGQVNQADEFDIRAIDTQVLVPNANTLVMGGLVQDNPNVQYTKVPILGDIPLLGYAFRSENKETTKGNLLIFITPTIVKDTDFHPTKTAFLSSKPRMMKGQIDAHSRWEGSAPNGDWSDPVQEKADGTYNPQ